mgnify:CR=1 FL=1
MDGSSKVTPRREFMRNVGLGMAAMAVTGVAARAKAEPRDDTVPDPDAWVKRITGKHRQVFDIVTPNDGWGLAFAQTFINQNMQAYGLKQSDISTVVSIRHMAIALVLNDAMWSRYKLGQFFKITDHATKAPATRNVFSHTRPGDMEVPGIGVAELISHGAIVTACNMAFTAMSGITAGAAGLPAATARSEWVANLIPGVVLVPAGVIAVNRAQENHCTYCYAG